MTAATDAEGRFAFAGVQAAEYRISAQRDNFQYKAPRRAEPLRLKPGENKRGVELKLTPLGAVAGSVRDENGDPAPNVQLTLVTWQYNASGRQLVGRGTATANDLGEYRIHGVAPGKYYVRATAPARRSSDDADTFTTVFYPGASDAAGASALDLRPGQELRGIDLTTRRAQMVTARGRVVKPAGVAMVMLTVSMNTDGGSMNTMNPVTDPEGRFELRGMVPGSYTLNAQATAGLTRYSARHTFQAGSADIEGIELALAPALTISGAIHIEGPTDVKPPQVMVRLDSPSGRSASTQAVRVVSAPGSPGPIPRAISDDGAFSIPNVDPDFYRVSATSPGSLFLKSATCGAADAIEVGVDLSSGAASNLTIVMSANGGQVEGQVQGVDSKPAASAQVTLIPAGTSRTDVFQSAVADASGRFRIGGIAPGKYRVYAWEDADLNAVRYDPEYAKTHGTFAEAIEIGEGERKAINLKQIPAPADL
jgi:protocatechuate 3,4-dioxygenase beta subunit